MRCDHRQWEEEGLLGCLPIRQDMPCRQGGKMDFKADWWMMVGLPAGYGEVVSVSGRANPPRFSVGNGMASQ